MSWDEAGTTPFRVKGAATNEKCVWGLHWGTVAATDTLDATEGQCFAAGKSCDEIVAVREMAGWTNEDLLFYCMFPSDGGDFQMSLSVQKLLGQPDQYSASAF